METRHSSRKTASPLRNRMLILTFQLILNKNLIRPMNLERIIRLSRLKHSVLTSLIERDVGILPTARVGFAMSIGGVARFFEVSVALLVIGTAGGRVLLGRDESEYSEDGVEDGLEGWHAGCHDDDVGFHAVSSRVISLASNGLSP